MFYKIFLKIIITIESLVIIRFLLVYAVLLILVLATKIPGQTLITESTNNTEKIVIYEIGKPFLFGSSTIQVEFSSQSAETPIIFQTDFPNDGANIGAGQFNIEWKSDCASITIMPSEAPDYIMEIAYP